ncbi:MAG TPA: hypothetical protein VKT52_03740 [Ktedonobacterales bacterium]|nr:hypothetical protein [Ktedonobacterales bacterium]
MSDPQLAYDLACMRQREMQRDAANARLVRAARQANPQSQSQARVLLPLANGLIALGMRLRAHYQPNESLALLPTNGQFPESLRPARGERDHSGNLLPVFAFQVVQCVPHRATTYTYWSLMPLTPGSAAGANGLGLICLARPLG